jgi:hypothetical protein
MSEPQKPPRKAIRIGLGFFLLVPGLLSLRSTIFPGPNDLRAANRGELTGMLGVGLAFVGFGLCLIVRGSLRKRQLDASPK